MFMRLGYDLGDKRGGYDKHHDFRNICPCRVGFHPMANLLFQEPNPGYS